MIPFFQAFYIAGQHHDLLSDFYVFYWKVILRETIAEKRVLVNPCLSRSSNYNKTYIAGN